MMLNIKTFASYVASILSILVLTLSVSLIVRADVLLEGTIKIGDNDTYRINPTAMLRAQYTHSGNLFLPQPVNPIHFNLTESVTLTRIDLDNITNTSANLYLVIWKDSGFTNVVVNTRSSGDQHGVFNLGQNIQLSKGNYLLAIVGQCFNPGGHAKGWSNNCNGNWNYDDFEYTNINLRTVSAESKTDSFAFIERRHIGDSTDRPRDGYYDRWYPDSPEGDEVEYTFIPRANANLESITIYNYRDLVTNSNNVEITLSEKDGPDLQSIYMNRHRSKGDFTWTINKELIANTEYELEIETDDDGDADDISWDDIVIKFGSDTLPPDVINHYRLTYSNRALTCEPAVVKVQACTNNFQSGRACVESTRSTSVTLVADAKNSASNISEPSGAFTGSTDINLGYLQEADLTLSLTDINGKVYRCNGSTNCNINFADTGFFFSYDNAGGSGNITNQVAGVNFSKPIRLDAFYNDKGQCKNIFKNNENIPVNLGIQCKEPGTCSTLDFIANNIKLGKNSGNQSAAYKPVDLKFNQNGTQIDGALYQDAGKINLIASYTINDNRNDLNGLTIKGSSNQFAVRPYRFQINAEHKPITVDLTAKDTSGTLINTHKAGEDFNFSVTAMNVDRVTTTNYQPDSNAILKLKLTRTIPDAGGADGKFAYANNVELSTQLVGTWQDARNLTAFKNGISTFESANYSEVGAFSMNIQDTDYYGMAFSVDAHADDDSNGTEIGRFIPDHFTLVSPDVTNYIETVGSNSNNYQYVFPHGKLPHDGSAYQFDYVANTRVLATDGNVYQCHSDIHESRWCQHITENGYAPGVSLYWDKAWDLIGPAGSGMTYMGQPELIFDYQLEARNSAEAVTQNYDGRDATVSFHALEGNTNLSPRLVGYTGSWLNGVYAPLTDGVFSRGSGPDGPFRLLLGINVEDSDAIDAKLVDKDMLQNGVEIAKKLSAEESELRFGRWFIYDGSGPIGSAFPVTMELQYYDPNKATGDGFIINIDDSKTPFYGGDVTTTLGSLTDDRGIFKSGFTSELMISSDSPGTAILKYINTPEWLMPADGYEPSARITFDFFYGNDRVIYRRRLN